MIISVYLLIEMMEIQLKYSYCIIYRMRLLQALPFLLLFVEYAAQETDCLFKTPSKDSNSGILSRSNENDAVIPVDNFQSGTTL